MTPPDVSVTARPAEIAATVAAAAGRGPASLLLTGGQIVNVFTNEVLPADLMVVGRLIAGVFDPEDGGAQSRRAQAAEVIDLGGAYLAPGLIDGHVHIESSLVTPTEYARAVLPRGVTGVVCDPHELANVAGETGVKWLIEASEDLPFDVWVTVPSCVPSTLFETAGGDFPLAVMESLLAQPRVVAVAELMSFPAVVAGDAGALAKAYLGDAYGVRVDGHAPALSGAGLQAYLASGVTSDHESTSAAEALEKLRSGAFLMVREGSVTRDLTALMPLLSAGFADRIGFVTDDRLPHDLLNEGGVDLLVRRALDAGVDPGHAVRFGSLNIAQQFRLPRRGAIAAGYFADLSVLDELAGFEPRLVFKAGKLVVEDGQLARDILTPPALDADSDLRGSVSVPQANGDSFRIAHAGGRVRVIEALPNQIITTTREVEVRAVRGELVADPNRDLLKLACLERHGKNGGVGLGVVSGFGLERGALASSVGHDHHNLMIVGANDSDMLLAAKRLEELGGGFVAVADGELLAELALPIAGLLTDQPLTVAKEALESLDAAARTLGCELPSPYMALSFLGLPVIPELRLTDLGLVDVNAGALVPLQTDEL